MSRWITLEKTGNEIKIEDGATLKVGQLVKMGLGSIEVRDTPKAGLHVVRLSGNGHFTYSLSLRRDGKYRLGAHRGHRVVEATEETDPIKRILRLMDIPVTALVVASEPTIQVDERWYDNAHCPNGRPTNKWIHDGQRAEVSSEQLEAPAYRGFFGGGGRNTATITGATWAICIDSGRYMNGSNWSRPGQIVVWPTCDPAELAETLAPLVYGAGADASFPEALNSAEAARQWIAERFETLPNRPGEGRMVSLKRRGSTQTDGFSIQMETTKNVVSLPGGGFGPIGRLVDRHGLAVVDLPEEAKLLLNAMSDKDAARKYVSRHYKLVWEEHRIGFLNAETGLRAISYGPEKTGSNYITTYTGNPGCSARDESIMMVIWTHGWDFIQSCAPVR